ncbi:hypothetical protein ACEQPO_10320 [Bacillus sp. SL00103]
MIAWNQKNDRMYHTSLWTWLKTKKRMNHLDKAGLFKNIEGQTELEIGYMLKKAACGKRAIF